MTLAPDTIPHSHGGPIPRLGFGVFRVREGRRVRKAVSWALEAGYRHADTAALYRNEKGVGRAVRESGLGRDEVFVTTKLWNEDHGDDPALEAFDAGLARLVLEYVDLYLIHWPVQDLRLESWRALERIQEEGRARAIGVSNYMVHHLEELLAHARTPAAVKQIELHPFNWRARRDVVELCREEDIVVETYSPLTKGRHLDDPDLARIAADVGRTPAQVLIRYALEKRTVVLPKSENRDRIRENARVFDFELGPGIMARLDDLDRGLSVAWDPAKVP